MKRRLHRITLLSVALLALVSAYAPHFARAADEPQPKPAEVYLLSSNEMTDMFAKAKLKELKDAGVTEVELYHVGDEHPEQLEGLMRWFFKNGIFVAYKQVTTAELEQVTNDQSKATAMSVPAVKALLKYSDKRPALSLNEIRGKIRQYFGLPGGISFLTYAQKRSNKERLVELGVAAAKVAVTSAVLVHTLAAKAALGEHVNIMFPVVVSAAFSLGFDYWQRGNSAFKGQGLDYDFERRTPVMNRKFYLLTAFVHSLVVREAIMISSHVTDVGFTMGWAAFFMAMQTSAKGLLGKAPVEMFIERGRRTHSQWWTIGWMTAWGSLYASLQILDLFQMGQLFRNTLTVLGVAGLGYELWLNRRDLFYGFERVLRKIKGKYTVERCESLLVAKEPKS